MRTPQQLSARQTRCDGIDGNAIWSCGTGECLCHRVNGAFAGGVGHISCQRTLMNNSGSDENDPAASFLSTHAPHAMFGAKKGACNMCAKYRLPLSQAYRKNVFGVCDRRIANENVEAMPPTRKSEKHLTYCGRIR